MTHFQERLLQYSSMKAIQILDVMLSENKLMKIQDISEMTGLSQSTVHRIMQELLACGFVTKDEKAKTYGIGLSTWLMSIKGRETNYLQVVAEEEMDRLNRYSGETIHLIAIDGEEATYVGKKEALCQIQLKSRIGWHIPLSCTSGGKAILAFKGEEWTRNYLRNNPLKRYTEKTITDTDAFFSELEKIRKQGYSIDDHEHNSDIVCVAAPIFDKDDEVIGTIGISAPDYKFSVEKAEAYAPQVMASAAAITRKLKESIV